MAARLSFLPNTPKIREIAETRCLPNGDLRRAAGLSIGGMRNAMSGRPVLQKTLFHLARVLEVSPAEISLGACENKKDRLLMGGDVKGA